MALSIQIRELVDAFSELVAQHVRLAKMELADDARFVGVRVGLIAALAPLILVGYGFLCGGLAIALSAVMPTALAFVVVGLLNLAAGGVGIAVAAKQLSQRELMPTTFTELESSRVIVTARPPEAAP